MLALWNAESARAEDTNNPQIAALQVEQEQAIEQVVAIVNQPIPRFPRRSWAPIFKGGWFHPGATAPDFDTVDIRKTQEFPYAKQDYVTSTANQKEIFYGPGLEFNAMTKYFYTDRTVPKKRLSEAEMVRINALYRVIGRDEKALAALEGRQAVTGGSEAGPAKKHSPFLLLALAALGIIVLVCVLSLKKKN